MDMPPIKTYTCPKCGVTLKELVDIEKSVAYAKKLLSILAPQIEPADDLMGLLSQIDNWSVGTQVTIKEAINILRTLEWSASYSSCTGWPCCPICHGIKPGYGRNSFGELPDNQGHFKSCKLAKVLLKEDSDGYTN